MITRFGRCWLAAVVVLGLAGAASAQVRRMPPRLATRPATTRVVDDEAAGADRGWVITSVLPQVPPGWQLDRDLGYHSMIDSASVARHPDDVKQAIEDLMDQARAKFKTKVRRVGGNGVLGFTMQVLQEPESDARVTVTVVIGGEAVTLSKK